MNSNFQDRLKNFEVDPPVGLWNKIGSVLDNKPEMMIAEKLVQFEIDPPIGSWAKISKALYSNPFLFRKPVKRFLLYGSIAACIIIAIVSVNLLTGNQTTTNDAVPASVTSEKGSNTPAPKENTVMENNIAAISSSNKLEAAVKKMVNRGYSFVHNYPAAIHENLMNTASSLNEFMPDYASRNERIPFTDDGSKYMIFASEDGNAVKLPKKIYGAFACSSDDIPCRDKLRLLQQKLASGSFNSDFAGMLDILTNIEDH